MRLNYDCIRDILIYIEDNTDSEKNEIFLSELLTNLSYSKNILIYHIEKIYQAGLIDDVLYADDEIQSISELSWEGHQYLENIRDDSVWEIIKEKANSMGSISFKFLISLAELVITERINEMFENI